jgi:hypothetical protein
LEFRRFRHAARFVFLNFKLIHFSFSTCLCQLSFLSLFLSDLTSHLPDARQVSIGSSSTERACSRANVNPKRRPDCSDDATPEMSETQNPILEYNDRVFFPLIVNLFISSLLLRIFPTYGLHEGRLHQGTTTQSRRASAPTSVPATCLKD